MYTSRRERLPGQRGESPSERPSPAVTRPDPPHDAVVSRGPGRGGAHAVGGADGCIVRVTVHPFVALPSLHGHQKSRLFGDGKEEKGQLVRYFVRYDEEDTGMTERVNFTIIVCESVV